MANFWENIDSPAAPAPSAPASAKPADVPFWQRLDNPSPTAAFQPTPEAPDPIGAAWQKVDAGKTRFSSLPEEVQTEIARRNNSRIDQGAATIANGALLGWAPQITAGLSAAAESLLPGAKQYAGKDFGEKYDDLKAYEKATLRAIGNDAPVTAAGLGLAGGIMAGKALPAIPAYADTMTGRGISALGTGGLYGAVAGASEGDTLTQKIANAATGSVIGAPLGLGMSLAADTIAPAVAKLFNPAARAPAVDPALKQYDQAAVKDMAQKAAVDNTGTYTAKADLERLGPSAALMDAGPGFFGTADSISNKPGQASKIMSDFARSRAEADPGRLQALADKTMGPAPANLIDAVDNARLDANAAAKQYYDIAYDQPIGFTKPLETLYSHIVQTNPGTLKEAANLAAEWQRTDPRAPQFFLKQTDNGSYTATRVPNVRDWDLISRTLGSMAKDAAAQQDFTRSNRYGNLARDINQQLYEGTATKVFPPGHPNAGAPDPSSSPLAQARAIAAEGFQTADALKFGADFWSKGTSPDEVQIALRNAAPAQREAMMAAARSHFNRLMGNASASLGNIGDDVESVVGPVRQMATPDNKAKLAMLFGPGAADDLNQGLQSAAKTAANNNKIYANSRTAARLAEDAQQRAALGTPENPGNALNLPGFLYSKASSAFGAASRARAQAALDRMNTSHAQMLTAQGPEAQRLLQMLTDYGLSQRAQEAAIAQARQAARPVGNGVLAGALAGRVAPSAAPGLLGWTANQFHREPVPPVQYQPQQYQ